MATGSDSGSASTSEALPELQQPEYSEPSDDDNMGTSHWALLT
jgi:hypothetical protein